MKKPTQKPFKIKCKITLVELHGRSIIKNAAKVHNLAAL